MLERTKRDLDLRRQMLDQQFEGAETKGGVDTVQLETALAERENDVLELQEERGELVSALEELRQLTDTGDLEMFEALQSKIATLEEAVWHLTQGPDSPVRDSRAIPMMAPLIGCDYAELGELDELQAGVADARRMYDVLGSLGIHERQLLGDGGDVPTLSRMRIGLDWLYAG